MEWQGKFEAADTLFLRALAIDEKVYGPNHAEVAKDLNNRALLLESQVWVMWIFFRLCRCLPYKVMATTVGGIDFN